MSAIVKNGAVDISGLESVLLEGDLSRLTAEQRVVYYKRVCESVGLNVLTSPMEYIKLNGKLVLYAKRAATDQLRKIHDVSITIVSREKADGMYSVVARAATPDGRTDESMGVVPVEGLKGDNLANAMLKAETKAKRRVTLAICGLSLLDETEVDSVRAVESQAKPAKKAKTLDEVAALPAPSEDQIVEYDSETGEVVQDVVTTFADSAPYTFGHHMRALPECGKDALGPWFDELQSFQLTPAEKRKAWASFSEKCAEFELNPSDFKKNGAAK